MTDKCRTCQKRLQVFHGHASCDKDRPPDPRHEIVKIYRDHAGEPYAYTYKDGIGYGGKGHFCSKDCGYQWALKVINDAEEGREEYQRAFD